MSAGVPKSKLKVRLMKRPVKRVLYALSVVGFVGTASLVKSQTSNSSFLGGLALAAADVNQDQPPATPAPQPDTSLPPPAGAATDKEVVQTRGPINQGFAETTDMTPQPSPQVAKQPPPPINEAPPDERPDNAETTWVPGYWSWAPDANNFVWVSGSWRVPPPGHRWMPGYWSDTDAGYQWVSGFWTPEDVEEMTYLPAPPSYRDEGVDVTNPPDDQHFWVPGYWAYRTRAYEWQPGYWSQVVPNWMWVAAHYVWTPYGYVFVAGHWDYPLTGRGMLFTPVAFTQPIYQNASFVYTPQYLVDVNNLVDNLFVWPGYQSYLFGDYYGSQYASLGIYPWFNLGVGPYLYDPIFAYQNTLFLRTRPRWRDDFRTRYQRLVGDPSARPPRTWRDYQRLTRGGQRLGGDRMVALPLNEAMRDRRFNQHVVRMSPAERQAVRERTESHRNLAGERSRLERANTVGRQLDRRPGERVPERPGMRPGERPLERPETRPIERPDTRPIERPETRPAERPAVPPELRREAQPGRVAEAPRTLRFPTRAPQVQERGTEPRTPNVRPAERPARINTPRPPQPDRTVRAPAARPAPARPEREKK
jgi:hypothetical protein